MTDQTTREAREWAEHITSVRDLHGDYAPQTRAAAQFILDNTTPVLPDPLFLAKATHPEYGEGIVVSHFPDEDGKVQFVFSNDAISDGSWRVWVYPYTLTFHTSDHPEFLESEEDYRNAPEGTIVAEDDEKPIVLVDELWRQLGPWSFDHAGMAGTRLRVLRWGWPA